MFLTMDVPDIPPQDTQVMIVQAGAAKPGAANVDRTLGVCQVIENRRLPSGEPKTSAVNSINPIGWIENYFSAQERREIEGPSTVTVLENPKHGELKDLGTAVLSRGALVDTGKRNFYYIPAPGYFGQDRTVMLAEVARMKIRIVYSFHVVKGFVESYPEPCQPAGVRKISLSTSLNQLA